MQDANFTWAEAVTAAERAATVVDRPRVDALHRRQGLAQGIRLPDSFGERLEMSQCLFADDLFQ